MPAQKAWRLVWYLCRVHLLPLVAAARMITPTQITAAVERLAQAAQPERILIFGSHARDEAREESDLDLLVIETEVPDRAAEMVRLRRLLRPLRIPVDILVYSHADVERWGNQPGSALFWALREGKVVYG